MNEFLVKIVPNVMQYSDKFVSNCIATLQMFFISAIFAFILGLFFGILLTITRKDGITENTVVFQIIDKSINIFRSIPFIILLIFVMPFTRFVMGTGIGVRGAIIPLVLGTVPFYSRQVETVLVNVNPGKIEAAKSMGTKNIDIIFKVLLREAVPELIRVATITSISLVGLTTMAGAVGAGGIGSFAINYGQNLFHQDIVNVCVIVLLIFICILQTLGSFLAKKTTNKKLFK